MNLKEYVDKILFETVGDSFYEEFFKEIPLNDSLETARNMTYLYVNDNMPVIRKTDAYKKYYEKLKELNKSRTEPLEDFQLLETADEKLSHLRKAFFVNLPFIVARYFQNRNIIEAVKSIEALQKSLINFSKWGSNIYLFGKSVDFTPIIERLKTTSFGDSKPTKKPVSSSLFIPKSRTPTVKLQPAVFAPQSDKSYLWLLAIAGGIGLYLVLDKKGKK